MTTELHLTTEDWLLNSAIRISTGKFKGAIAGWLNENGDPEFVYPEITGYYLSWLRFANSSGSGFEMEDWLGWLINQNEPPATRYYMTRSSRDWRNNATFTFDLAMLARGVKTSGPVLNFLLGHLSAACQPDGPLPAVANAKGELPHRWSTRPGAYQLKAAAAILFGIESVPAMLSNAAWNTYDRWRSDTMILTGRENLHGTLYALEGLVQFGDLETAAERFANVCDSLELWRQDPRSDVVAQAIRLGCILRSTHSVLRSCRDALRAFVDDSGSVSFRPLDHRPIHWNTWSAIFTHQALVFLNAVSQGQDIKPAELI